MLGFVLGLLLALGRLSRVGWVSWFCTAYIEIARTVPVLLLIYLMLFGLPQLGLNFPVLWKLVIPLTLANRPRSPRSSAPGCSPSPAARPRPVSASA